MTALAEWGNFYVIVGSSAGALIGSQFVVIMPHRDRGSASASANHLQARVRGLVVPCSASIRSIRSAGCIGMRKSANAGKLRN